MNTDLYQPYPWVFRNATMTVVSLECDEQALSELLPEGLDLKRPANVVAWAMRCEGIAGVGSYTELMLNVLAVKDGKTVSTTPFIYVDNDAAMASGREVLGVPKRIATFDQQMVNDQIITRATRSGVDFATLGMTMDREGSLEDRSKFKSALEMPSLNLVNGSLVRGTMEATVHRVIHGRGFIDARPSASDPLYLLRPQAVSATYLQCDLRLIPPTPVEDVEQ